MDPKLFKLTFSVDCDIMVVETNPKIALDVLTTEDVINEIRNVLEIEFAHAGTEEVTKLSQVPREWRGSDPYGLSIDTSVDGMARDIEEKMNRKKDREFAERNQITLPGVD